MKDRPHLLSATVASIMLVAAIAPFPYEYYIILRWITCLAALHLGSIGIYWRDHGTLWMAIVFGCIAILFNPITPVYLTKIIWIPIDLICSILFACTIAVKKPLSERYGAVEIIGGTFAMALATVIVACVALLIWELIKHLWGNIWGT
jgi:hypothetical protein